MDDPFQGLSTRARNVLLHRFYGIETHEDVRKACEKGKFNRVFGVGEKTRKEILVWAGFEAPPSRPKRIRKCPHCGKEIEHF